MEEAKPHVSVGWAILVGMLGVNGPVLFLLLGPLVYAALAQRSGLTPDTWFVVILFGAGFVLAWTWWSLTVPRWRIWAYERVDEIERLKTWSIRAGITWPDDSPFGRTEIKSEAQRRRERELERRHGKRR